MSEVFYKEAVLRVYPEARCTLVRPRNIPLYVIQLGGNGRYLGDLSVTSKDAWQSAYEALPKGKAGDGAGQMGLGLENE